MRTATSTTMHMTVDARVAGDADDNDDDDDDDDVIDDLVAIGKMRR